MLSKLSRNYCYLEYPIMPLRKYDVSIDEEEIFYPKTYKGFILRLPAKSFRGIANQVGKELKMLASLTGYTTFLFLGDMPTPWVHQLNSYKPVAEAQQYLSQNKIGKRFSGGILVDREELPVFVKHLAWLVRCNAGLPFIYFSDIGQNIIGSLCRYGNIHIDTLSSASYKKIAAATKKTKLRVLKNPICTDTFSKTNTITGRKLVI